jgi:hypothetical protein
MMECWNAGIKDHWNTGIMEYGVGKFRPSFQYSIIPRFQYSSIPIPPLLRFIPCFRPERLGLKRGIAFLEKGFKAAFLLRLFETFVEFLALG